VLRSPKIFKRVTPADIAVKQSRKLSHHQNLNSAK
jgi:hypothetical protein